MAPISATSFCTGDSISVNFTASGFLGHKNVFTLQLSDPSGSFQNGFTNLASFQDTLPGTFTIFSVIPGATAPSALYRFRIAAAIPYVTSNDNGQDIKVCLKPYKPGVEFGPDNYAFAGKKETLRIDDIPDATISWDFGPDANPRTASGTLPRTTYATGGDKFITVTIVSSCGCSITGTYVLHVFDCTPPSIPKNAIVIDGDSITTISHAAFWVNPGAKLQLLNTSQDTIFAESGSVVAAQPRCSYNIYYLKTGASITNEEPAGANLCIFADGTSGGVGFDGSGLSCPNLNFDYSNAPYNPAQLSVSKDHFTLTSIMLFPNPTKGLVAVHGLPLDDLNLTVLDLLGKTVLELMNPHTADLTLDLSKLIPGTYYIRFSSANSVVTKMVVKD